MKEKTDNRICPDCKGLIKIRNPTGKCDHLYYPEYKEKTLSDLRVQETNNEFSYWEDDIKQFIKEVLEVNWFSDYKGKERDSKFAEGFIEGLKVMKQIIKQKAGGKLI